MAKGIGEDPARSPASLVQQVDYPATREEIVRSDGMFAAEAESVIVPRDPQADRSRSLTKQERELLQAELDRDAGAG